MDFVFLSKFFGEREMQLMEVVEGILGYLRASCATEEEGCFGVLDGFGGLFVEGSFAASVARLSASY
jgi:hypothetical protein